MKALNFMKTLTESQTCISQDSIRSLISLVRESDCAIIRSEREQATRQKNFFHTQFYVRISQSKYFPRPDGPRFFS